MHKKNSTLGLVSGCALMLLATTSAQAQAQTDCTSSAPLRTYLPCGNNIYAVVITPSPGFDPLVATPGELELNGFPPRPTDGSQSLAAWTRQVTSPIDWDSSCADLTPSATAPPLRSQQERHPHVSPNIISPETVVASGNWSGNVATGHAYAYARGSWNTVQARGDGTQFAYSSTWVGLGSGDSSSTPLFQAGTEANGDGQGSVEYKFWWEVYPQLNTQHVDDQGYAWPDSHVFVSVAETSTGAEFHFISGSLNHTWAWTGRHTTDDQAEWIFERQTEDGFYPLLADSPTSFTDAQARTASGSMTGVGNLPHYDSVMRSCDGGKTLLAAPGNIAPNGTDFKEYWYSFGTVDYPDQCNP